MMNQASKFGPEAVLGILKRLNGLDFTNEPHIILEIAIQRSRLFCTISKSMRDQRLKCDQLVVFDLPEIVHGLDHDYGPHRNQKIGKNTIFFILFFALCETNGQ